MNQEIQHVKNMYDNGHRVVLEVWAGDKIRENEIIGSEILHNQKAYYLQKDECSLDVDEENDEFVVSVNNIDGATIPFEDIVSVEYDMDTFSNSVSG